MSPVGNSMHAAKAVCEQVSYGDHAGGVAPVLRSFPTGEFADSGQRYPGFAYNDALQVAKIKRTPIIYPRAGAIWRTDDGLTLTFLGPSLPLLTHTRNDINNNSLAFVLQYGNFRMLFTGDAGAAAEQRFLSEGIDLHADARTPYFARFKYIFAPNREIV
jgi:beta-lactamase superfamily II metal-dependent hydrolase